MAKGVVQGVKIKRYLYICTHKTIDAHPLSPGKQKCDTMSRSERIPALLESICFRRFKRRAK